VPSFIWSNATAASVLDENQIAGWQYERVPSMFVNGAYVAVLQRSVTAGMTQSIFTGSQNILQKSPIQAGGTAGVTPAPLETPVIDWRASPDDLLQVLVSDTVAAVNTIDGIVTIEPI